MPSTAFQIIYEEVRVSFDASSDVVVTPTPVPDVQVQVQDTNDYRTLYILPGPGPAGPPGPSSQLQSYPAAEPISALRVVSLGAGTVSLTDPGDLSSLSRATGIAVAAAASGAEVSVLRSGRHSDGSWSWTAGDALFCGADGTLTSTPPVAVGSRVIAVATSPTEIQLDISDLFILE